MTAREEERRRLRRDLHDSLGLVDAIRQQAARHGQLSGTTPEAAGRTNGPVFTVEAPEELPPAVEVVPTGGTRVRACLPLEASGVR